MWCFSPPRCTLLCLDKLEFLHYAENDMAMEKLHGFIKDYDSKYVNHCGMGVYCPVYLLLLLSIYMYSCLYLAILEPQ